MNLYPQIKLSHGKNQYHKMTAQFDEDILLLKGKLVKQNKPNSHEIKRYTHKIKIENNYAKHAMTAKTDNLNFILTIPKK